jgi:alkanesulfonate monooxygenase SsuD/methylene tetrahydromethanopterin reductase-like flavin-dependent oxidoreductase (luciferase family)
VNIGVNVPNFGPGTNPAVLRRWAQTIEGLGFDLLMVSDHIALTPDVSQQYPAPFYEPFTTLAWLSGVTDSIRLGTTVLVVPYRHPLLVARMAANLNELSEGRLILGVGVGWAREEFDALNVSFEQRGSITTEYLKTIRTAWRNEADYHAGQIPIWVGGNSNAAILRAVLVGDAWHPLRFTLAWLREATARMTIIVNDSHRPTPLLAPRIALRATDAPIPDDERIAGEGSIEQVIDDLEQLYVLGACTVVLDPFNGDPDETRHPEVALEALAMAKEGWNERELKLSKE